MKTINKNSLAIQGSPVSWLSSFAGAAASIFEVSDGLLESLAIRFEGEEGALCFGFPELEGEKEGSRWHVEAGLLNAMESPTPYLNARFYDGRGLFVDGAYMRGSEERFSFDASLQTIEGRKMLCLFYSHATPGETIRLSLHSLSQDALDPLHGHFGGTLLFMPKKHYSQMEGFLLRSAEGKVVCIDGGETADAPELYEQIKQWGGLVDGWYFSHYHCDHVDAFLELMSNPKYSDLRIRHLYFDFRVPPRTLEQYGDADNHCIGDVERAIEKADSRIEEVAIPHKGDRHSYGKTLSIETLNDAAFLAAPNMPNDSSIVFKALTPKESILFLGDIGSYGDELILDPLFCKEIGDCSFVQLAHHGQNGASRAFYAKCNGIKVALAEAPRWLFDNDIDEKGCGSGPWSSLETRKWLRALGVRYYFDEEKDVMFD